MLLDRTWIWSYCHQSFTNWNTSGVFRCIDVARNFSFTAEETSSENRKQRRPLLLFNTHLHLTLGNNIFLSIIITHLVRTNGYKIKILHVLLDIKNVVIHVKTSIPFWWLDVLIIFNRCWTQPWERFVTLGLPILLAHVERLLIMLTVRWDRQWGEEVFPMEVSEHSRRL